MLSAQLIVFITFGIIFGVLQYILKYRRYYQHALKIPPLHPTLPRFFGPIISILTHKLDFYRGFMSIKRNNEDLYATWLMSLTVYVKKPEFIKILCHDHRLNDKSMHYGGITDIIGPTGLLSASGKDFKPSRQAFTRCFNASSQKLILLTLLRGAKELVETLEKQPKKKYFKLEPIIKNTTLTNIFRSSMDSEPKENCTKIIDNLHEILQAASLKYFFGILQYDPYITPISRIVRDSTIAVRELCQSILEEKKMQYSEYSSQNSEAPNQFIYNVLRDRKLESDVRADIATLIAAATDTTMLATCFVLDILGLYQDVQNKVFDEIIEVENELKGVDIETNDLAKYEYLHRVIKETLRIYPAVPTFLRRVPEDIQMGQYTVPKGSSIGLYIPFIHRDPDYWPDPLKFDPDRFLPQNMEKLPDYAYVPFGYGKRQCPGIRYGPLATAINVIAVIRKFRVYSKYQSFEEMDKNISGSITIYDKEGFTVRIEPRA